MHSALVNARPPLIRLGVPLSFSFAAGIACTRNLDIYFNCSEGFEGPGFSQLSLVVSDSGAWSVLPADDIDFSTLLASSVLIADLKDPGFSFHRMIVFHPFVIV